MEFTIGFAHPSPDLRGIEDALRSIDPAALVDVENGMLRIAGAFDAPTLLTILRQAGQPLTIDHINQLPSVCCGGCSG